MGVRYRKSKKIAPGTRVSIGRKSAGISFGNKGGGISFNSRSGVRVRASIPGTGISFSSKLGGKSRKSSSPGCLLTFLLLPFYALYFVCIWPFVMLYRLVTKSSRYASQERASATTEAAAMAPQYLRIIDDCSRLLKETKNPEVFFSRYDLLLETLLKLSEIENIAPIKGARPSDELQRFLSMREEATGDFIERYARDTRAKIYELSTPKGKANKAEAFKNIMFEYADKMTEDNMRHVMLAYEDMKNNAVNL